ncbi:unnamed protein product [Rotaria magnacalcarata]|uniref:Uncharacterized protein n=1 Tax=Rotaria magnacalcarata TaxID=392030 RepID=A0A8S3HHC2_9BILA|nr:unnamed protein product [Rotaria magnacalcarata]CAF5180547.1 unnamed protein product [Rotaria magnacalcarata]
MKYSNNINIIDKSNPLFTLAQDALEKEKNDQQQYDVTQKLKLAWSHFRPAKSNLSPTHVASTAAVAAAAAVDDNNVEVGKVIEYEMKINAKTAINNYNPPSLSKPCKCQFFFIRLISVDSAWI